MTRYGRRPVPLGPVHLRGCHCPRCDRTAAAAAEAERLKKTAADEAARATLARSAVRAEVKAAVARDVIAKEVVEGNQVTARLRAAHAAADADPKAARLRELRAAGKTLAEAFEIIDAEEI